MTKQRNSLFALVVCGMLTACGGGGGTTNTTAGGGNSSVVVPDGGRLLASQCFQCHGTEGVSVGGIEGLAGEAGEIASEMQEMKYSLDLNDIMHRQAKGYSDSEIQAIAAYFANRYGTTAGGGDD